MMPGINLQNARRALYLVLLPCLAITLAYGLLIGWAAVNDPRLAIQTETQFLTATSQVPGPGSRIEWCQKQAVNLTLRNGDVVSATQCSMMVWIPIHANTAWPVPTAAPLYRPAP